jgi:hypothetical protein
MSSVIESSQLTFDWDVVAESNLESRGIGHSVPCDTLAISTTQGERTSQVSTGRASKTMGLNRAGTETRPRVQQSRAEHIGGLMLQVLARYGISQDEFLVEYDRQMRAKNG